MSAAPDGEVAVVGSGIIGTISAINLHAAGFDVVVVEPDEPGAGTAAGSAGYLHDGEIFPVAHPALLAALPRMLLDPRGPLVVRPSYLPAFAGWGLRFLGAMRSRVIRRATAALASLNRDAVNELAAVAAASDAAEFLVRGGGLKIVYDKRTLHELVTQLTVLQREGIAANALDAAQVHDMEPALGPTVAGAIFFPNSAHCTDPERFGKRLAQRMQSASRILRARARSLRPKRDGTWVILVDQHGALSQLAVRRVLVCAGYHSASLLEPLGYRVPLAPARGYHLMIGDPGVAVTHPMIFHEPHFGATPMNEGLRLAGTMEFALPQSPPDFRRAHMLYEQARRYIPGLKNEGATQWAGVRPSMPDSIPAMGAAKRHQNLYYCFGHGHLGLTQAAVSARAMTQLMSGARASIDLEPFDLARFE